VYLLVFISYSIIGQVLSSSDGSSCSMNDMFGTVGASKTHTHHGSTLISTRHCNLSGHLLTAMFVQRGVDCCSVGSCLCVTLVNKILAHERLIVFLT